MFVARAAVLPARLLPTQPMFCNAPPERRPDPAMQEPLAARSPLAMGWPSRFYQQANCT